MKKFFWPVAAVVILAAVACVFVYKKKSAPADTATKQGINPAVSEPARTLAWPAETIIAEPISGALSRMTKKPFGIHVTPKDSPVSPERFTGYHTGVDFETTASEQNIDVPVYAICSGTLLVKERASGYGGVINESCVINGEAVTVTYGHLRLSSVDKKIGQALAQGEKIGVLGKGYSTETNGERKHLHLGIHKGKIANIKGYVATNAELGQWINVMDYLK